MNATSALCATLGMDTSEMRDYQYQPGVFPRAVYAIGNTYFCVGKTAPKGSTMKHLGSLDWQKHNDQFWAEKSGTVIWEATLIH